MTWSTNQPKMLDKPAILKAAVSFVQANYEGNQRTTASKLCNNYKNPWTAITEQWKKIRHNTSFAAKW